MRVSDLTRKLISRRRRRRSLEKSGYQKVMDTGEPLWKFQRGDWARKGVVIEDVQIDPDRVSLWIKVSTEHRG